MHPVRVKRGRASDGFIIVAVLWILAALATLAMVYAAYVANAVAAARVNEDRIQGQALVSAAVELAALQLTAGEQDTRPARGTFTFRMGGSSVAVEFHSEAGRIDLNMAPKPLLAGLFAALGARYSDAEQFADRIIGWRTIASATTQVESREASAYRTAGQLYAPREGPFPHVGELGLVMGIPPQLVEAALPYVTVFSGKAELNILDAAPLALGALPGMTPELLNAVLDERSMPRPNGQRLLGLVSAAQGAATIEASKASRIRIQVRSPKGRALNAVVVILILDNADEPYRVLSWRDDADGPITDEPRAAERR